MVDQVRVLSKLEELTGYLAELRAVLPEDKEQYQASAIKRACERLIQLCVECTIDISKKLVIGRRLGIPNDEIDLFEKLKTANVFSEAMLVKLKAMRGLRNVLVHEYTDIDDDRVYEILQHHLDDFEQFIMEVKRSL